MVLLITYDNMMENTILPALKSMAVQSLIEEYLHSFKDNAINAIFA